MIQLHGVSLRDRSHHRAPVLDRVDLTVAEGEVVVITGATGAGKSTLLELIYAARLADAGTVEVFGRSLARLRRSSLALLRQRLGVVPQALALLDDRSARDNVALALEVRAEPGAATRAAAILEELGLGDHIDTPVRRLSLGQKQLVAVARAVVRDPAVLVADEPTAHMDPAGCAALIQRLCASARRGVATILASNDPRIVDAAAQHGWRLVQLTGGQLRPLARARSAPDATAPDTTEHETSAVLAEDNVIPFPLAAHAGGLFE